MVARLGPPIGLQLLVLSCGGKSVAGNSPLPSNTVDGTEALVEQLNPPTLSSEPALPDAKPAREQRSDFEASSVDDPLPAPPLVVLTESYLPLLRDAEQLPADSKPFIRYIALSPTRRDQHTVINLVLNSTSLSAEPSEAVALENEQLIRFDLRQFSWDRSLVVDGIEFADGWEAVVHHSGLELPALPESSVERLFKSVTPVLPAPAFVAAVTSAPVYYALTNAPATTWELEERLEVVRPEYGSSDFLVAGIAPTRHRYQGVRRYTTLDGRPFWQGLPDTPRGNSLFVDPLSFNEWEADAIYVLPNGFPGFLIGPLRGDEEHRSAMSSIQRGKEDQLVASCLGCHLAGAVSVEDLLPGIIADNPYLIAPGDLDNLDTHWPSQNQLDAVVAKDAQARLGALAQAGLDLNSAVALQSAIQRLEAGLSIDDLATALHAQAASVQATLNDVNIPMTLAELRRRFPEFVCQLHPDAVTAPNYCRNP